jgi:hypothetical protein
MVLGTKLAPFPFFNVGVAFTAGVIFLNSWKLARGACRGLTLGGNPRNKGGPYKVYKVYKKKALSQEV